ncbi:Ferritin [Saccharopolyspora antimicrobica]|uniref:Ferritin n=1 Tax=Saccharopolyspora antimicrobica TaxID=455193 RepID=A0A1I4X3E5_9PSEU|nr:ferritin [Saccharopolyspora antimicrobica]RKT84284.1 ferritin [Saccharopolyspora antimicrobica]SFN20155.1 Ferritin [Saccharopolyspora antimicrobica]
MTATAKKIQHKESKFEHLLQEQVRNEFTASHQYIAVAVWFDDNDLPQLAGHFYRQALEERNHAMMIVQYLMDNDIKPIIPAIEQVRNDFNETRELVALALEQEREVTREIETLAKTAREEGNYLGEQFMQWFLKEQVEEVSQMSTLLNVVDRAKGNLFDVENFLARETVGDEGADATAPKAAGGSV